MALDRPWGYLALPERVWRSRAWARHQHFGLRSEWLALYLGEPQEWPRTGGLGVRQVQSLRAWLRTTGLVDRRGRETRLCHPFHRTWPESLLAWQLLWANVVFNFRTAAWYVFHAGIGVWTTTELRSRLGEAVPRLAKRTVSNAVLELAGLLERTPGGGPSSGRASSLRCGHVW